MDLIRSFKNKTAKLSKSIRSRLTTRRSRSRIAPEPAELPPFDSRAASLSPIAESVSPRRVSVSPRLASLSPRRVSVSPRRVSLSPRTKVVTHIQRTFRKSKREQTLADLSKLNSKRRATRRIQKRFRTASANPNLQECPICYGTMLQPKLTQTLRCCHIFHRKCLKEWSKDNKFNPICPICRTSIVPEQPHDLQTRLSMTSSFNINIANTDVVIDCVNTLIEGILNAATIQEAQVLLDESDVLIHSLPYKKRGELATERIQAQFKAYPRLEALRAKHLEELRAKRSKKTNDAINRANYLIESMYSATTKEQLTKITDELSIIIINLPSDEEEKEELTNRQWTSYMRAYTRLSPPIQRRAPITVNGITTRDYNRSTQLDTHPTTGITPAEYDRLIR
jgi:hypothetical protein